MLSVIIPCQEDGMLLTSTLKSIFQNEFSRREYEVLLIRNHNVDISNRILDFPIADYCGSFDDQAQAINWAVAKAHGEIFCLTKPGCIVANDWLLQIRQFFENHKSVQGVGGPVLPCWEWGTKIQRLASEIFHEEQGFPTSVTISKPNRYYASFHATNSAFRREVFDLMKFDESLRYDYDFDFCWKLLRAGRQLVFNPRMRVQYIFPSSIYSIFRRYYVWGYESILLKKRHLSRIGFQTFAYFQYSMLRSLLEPKSLVSRKKLLRFVQHLAFDLGNIRGYGLR